jgi:hypothetical protein
MDMDLAVSGPLVRCSRLVPGSYPSTRTFALRFLQTSPRGDSPCVVANPSPPSGWVGRDRDTARPTLGTGLGCFGVSAVRARLALSIVRVSVRPPCHPGRSYLASPVGDHDCPSVVFPVSRRLKRSLAYPHATQVYCTVRWSSTCSTFSGAESGAGAHLPSVMTESPFAPSRRYPLGRRVPAS